MLVSPVSDDLHGVGAQLQNSPQTNKAYGGFHTWSYLQFLWLIMGNPTHFWIMSGGNPMNWKPPYINHSKKKQPNQTFPEKNGVDLLVARGSQTTMAPDSRAGRRSATT